MKLKDFMTAMYNKAESLGMADWEVGKLDFSYPEKGKTVLSVEVTDGKDSCYFEATYVAREISRNHTRVDMVSLDCYEA